MLLDPPTLFASSGIISLVLSGLMFLSWRQDRLTNALLWWSCATLLGAVGLIVFILGGGTATSTAREVGNALFLFGYGCSFVASCRFNGRPVSLATLFAGPFAWLAVVWIVEIGFAARVTYVSVLFAVYATATAWVLWRGERLVFQRAAAIVTSFQALFFWARAASGPAIFMNGGDETLQSIWAEIIGIETLIYVSVFGFIVMAMAKERGDIVNRRAAFSDSLTGVANRRGFLEAAEQLAAVSRGAPFAVMLFDLDMFKTINDRHGHQVGDTVLIKFCEAIKAEVQDGAIVGRLGGEEFAVSLAGLGIDQAELLADRIRLRFARSCVIVSGRVVEPTVSAGISADPVGMESLVTLLGQADAALYRAKAAGRNRVVVAGRAGAPGRAPAVRTGDAFA